MPPGPALDERGMGGDVGNRRVAEVGALPLPLSLSDFGSLPLLDRDRDRGRPPRQLEPAVVPVPAGGGGGEVTLNRSCQRCRSCC